MPDQETQTDSKSAILVESQRYPSVSTDSSPSHGSISLQPIIPTPIVSTTGDEESQQLPETPRSVTSDNRSVVSVSRWSNLRGIFIEKTLNLGYICIFATFLILWGHKACDQSLALYLTVKASVIAFKLPDKVLSNMAENRPRLKNNSFFRFFKFLWMISDYFAFCWFLVGNVYLWRIQTCSETNPNLYWLVFADTIFTWTVMILSFGLLVVANIIRRRQERYEAQMAALASMGAGASRGLSPRELSRLRTFSFRMMDKNVPQPPASLIASNIENLANRIPMNQMTQMTKTRLTRWRSESNLFSQRRNQLDSFAEEVDIPFDERVVAGLPKITIISEEMLEKIEQEELEEKRQNRPRSFNVQNPPDINLTVVSTQLSPLENNSQTHLPANVRVPSLTITDSVTSVAVSIPTLIAPHLRQKQVNRSRSLDSIATSHISTQIPSSFRQSRTSSFFDNSVSLTRNVSSFSNDSVKLQSDSQEDCKPTSSHETCAVCFEVYESGDRLRELACSHVFHKDCIDEWLRGDPDTGFGGHRTCPLCVQEAVRPEDRDNEWIEAEFDVDENEDDQQTSPVDDHQNDRRNRRRFFGRRSRSASRHSSVRHHNTGETQAEFLERVLRESEMGSNHEDHNGRSNIESSSDRRRTWVFVRPNQQANSPRRAVVNNRNVDVGDSEVIREEEEDSYH